MNDKMNDKTYDNMNDKMNNKMNDQLNDKQIIKGDVYTQMGPTPLGTASGYKIYSCGPCAPPQTLHAHREAEKDRAAATQAEMADRPRWQVIRVAVI